MARNFSNEPDARMLGWLRTIESTALVMATIIAAVVLILWFLPVLDQFAPAFWSKATANTAARHAGLPPPASLSCGKVR